MTATVAFFVSRFPAETFIRSQVEGLLERGLSVEVYTLAAGIGQEEEELKSRWGDKLPIYLVPVDRSFARRAIAAIPWLLRGNRSGLSHRFGYDAASLRLLLASNTWPHVRPHKRVWLAQYGRWGRLACMLRDLGIISGPIATMFHGKDMSALLARRPNSYRQLLRQGELFLPISKLWHSRLIALGAPRERTLVHHMGVDVNAFRVQPRLIASPQDIVRFISVGRMVEKKGFDDALEAFASFQAQPGAGPATLTIVGDGPLRSALERRAAGLSLSDKVRFTGVIANSQVAKELQAAHIFLLPSRTAGDGDMEGVPVAVMEAMAQGMPILATRHSGIPELVDHGVSGLLSPEGDRQDLARNMRILADEPTCWSKMGAQGAERVRQDYNLTHLNDRLAILLQELALNPLRVPHATAGAD